MRRRRRRHRNRYPMWDTTLDSTFVPHIAIVVNVRRVTFAPDPRRRRPVVRSSAGNERM